MHELEILLDAIAICELPLDNTNNLALPEEPPLYVPPTFHYVENCDTLESDAVFVQAPAAVGKSMTAKYISAAKNAPVLDLSGSWMMQPNTDPHVGATMPESPVFATYLEAHHEAARRRAQEAERGFIVQVVKSPYGGFYVRSWPEEALAEPEMRALIERDQPDYRDI